MIRPIALIAATSLLVACQSNTTESENTTTIDYTRVTTLPSGSTYVAGSALDSALRGNAFEGVSDSGYIYYGRYEADGTGAIVFDGGDTYQFTWRQSGDEVCSDYGQGEECSPAVLNDGWLLFAEDSTVVAQIRVIDDVELPEWAEI